MIGYVVFLVGMAVLVAAMAITQHIRTRQRGMLALVAVAVEKQLPLAPTIEAYAAEQGGWFGRRAKDFAVLLREGVPLAEAMELLPGVLPRSAKLAVRVGEQLDALGPALRDVVERQSAQQPLWQAMAGRVLYATSIVFFLVMILTFMLIKIIPAMIKIFEDFDSTLPRMTVLLIQICNTIASSALAIVAVFAMAVVFGYAVLAYVGWVVPDRGLLGRWLVELDRAKILRALSLAVERGRSLEETLTVLYESYPKRWIRQKLDRARQHIASGLGWHEALRREGLVGKNDAALLEAAERAGNLAWALNETASGNERRLYYRVEGTVHIVFPMLILLIGGAVLFVAVAFFLPLVKLIQQLS